jgi:hypothetical protein
MACHYRPWAGWQTGSKEDVMVSGRRRLAHLVNWNRIAATTLLAFPPAAGGAPPALQINLAMARGAVYDAVNAIEPRHDRPYLLQRRFAATASREAAAATAAYRVLSSIVSTVPASIGFPNRASLLQSLDVADHMAQLYIQPVGH